MKSTTFENSKKSLKFEFCAKNNTLFQKFIFCPKIPTYNLQKVIQFWIFGMKNWKNWKIRIIENSKNWKFEDSKNWKFEYSKNWKFEKWKFGKLKIRIIRVTYFFKGFPYIVPANFSQLLSSSRADSTLPLLRFSARF